MSATKELKDNIERLKKNTDDRLQRLKDAVKEKEQNQHKQVAQ